MSASIRIIHARAIDAHGEYERLSLGIREGRIVHADATPPDGLWDIDIDAEGLLLAPAWIELAARLREPGATHKADIASELRAAARCGVAAVTLPPDTRPVVDRPAVVDWIRTRVHGTGSPVQVHILGAATVNLAGTEISEMGALANAGCIAIAQCGDALRDTAVMRRVLEYAASFDLPLRVQPVDAALAGEGCAHEGAMATRMGLPPVPVAAETCAVGQWLSLVEATGARVHFGRLSSGRGAEMVAQARAAGLPVSADVALHQLLLTDAALRGFDTAAHVQPPLRSEADRATLCAQLAQGGISALCCDHQPHEYDAKNAPFDLSEAGASGMDTAWSMALSLLDASIIDGPQLIRACHSQPLEILGQPAQGLAIGARADLVLLDRAQRTVVDPRFFASRGRNTPLAGKTTGGSVALSCIAGVIEQEALDAHRLHR